MAKIRVFTAERSAAIEAAAIVSGVINGVGRLILQRNDGSTIDAGAVLGTVPSANTGVAGLVALATGAEAIAGTDSSKAVTPNALQASITDRQSTNADVTAGTSTTKYVTPASLVSRLATTALAGLVRLATSAEAQAGTATDRAVTPAGLASIVGTGTGYRYGGAISATVASSTFTKSSYPGLRAVRVRCWGSGGAGGGAAAASAGQHTVGGGGGAGGYSESFILASALAATETITVPSGGTGVVGGAGNDGGDVSFGTLVIAKGGLGGETAGSNALATSAIGGKGGGNGTGDIIGTGAPGTGGTGDATLAISGVGGSGYWGGGGQAVYTPSGSGSNAGNNGTGWGAGGGGAAVNAGGTAKAGGVGTRGMCLVELYY